MQRGFGFNAPGNDRPSRAGRLPMKEEAPAQRDPDSPYLTLYCVLAGCLCGLGTVPELNAWIRENRPAFDALTAGSPDRAARLRQIYELHRANLAPHAATVQAEPPPLTLPAAELVDTILTGAGDEE